jgi:hypothetical protein
MESRSVYNGALRTKDLNQRCLLLPIFSVVSHALIATQEGFKDVIMHLLRMEFDKEIDEQGISIELMPLDQTDNKTVAEITNLVAQAAQHLDAAGASAETKSNFIDAMEDIPIRHAVFTDGVEDDVPDGDDSDEPELDDAETVK